MLGGAALRTADRRRRIADRPCAAGAIRRVLLDNAANYRKDRLQHRVLSAGLNDGLFGSTFALQEATLVLAAIVRHFSFQLRPGHAVWPSLRVTLRPANGLPMTIRARASKDAAHREPAFRQMMDS